MFFGSDDFTVLPLDAVDDSCLLIIGMRVGLTTSYYGRRADCSIEELLLAESSYSPILAFDP
jgi:hypothetical protein